MLLTCLREVLDRWWGWERVWEVGQTCDFVGEDRVEDFPFFLLVFEAHCLVRKLKAVCNDRVVRKLSCLEILSFESASIEILISRVMCYTSLFSRGNKAGHA